MCDACFDCLRVPRYLRLLTCCSVLPWMEVGLSPVWGVFDVLCLCSAGGSNHCIDALCEVRNGLIGFNRVIVIHVDILHVLLPQTNN